MRLIDGDALESKICWACSEEFSESPCEPNDCRILEIIRNAPAIEAEPVRHGEWEIVDATSYDDICTCSECGGFAPSGYIKSNYCPKCGAKMNGGEKE